MSSREVDVFVYFRSQPVMSIVTAVFFVLPLLIASSVGFTQDKDKNYCNIFLLEISTCPPVSFTNIKLFIAVSYPEIG